MIIEDLRTVEYFSDLWNFLAGFQMNIFETGLLRFFDASMKFNRMLGETIWNLGKLYCFASEIIIHVAALTHIPEICISPKIYIFYKWISVFMRCIFLEIHCFFQCIDFSY